MLYFPSTNSAAHRPADRDVTQLHSLLDDDVWAFTNCRVETPARPVAEIDWFFYNARTGCLMVSEWKRFPSPVSFAADTGKPWLLADGTAVDNPIEQVSRQLDAVRLVIRRSVLPHHFKDFSEQELRLAQCVYSPQADAATVVERLRFGKVYGTLGDLAAVIQTLSSPSPLLLSDDDGARLALARTFCSLFRCSMSAGVEAALRAERKDAKKPCGDAARRISEIHREIARLHLELADLTAPGVQTVAVKTTPVAPPVALKTAAAQPSRVKAQGGSAPVAVAAPKAAATKKKQQKRMMAHLSSAFQDVNGSADAARSALGQAWIAVLRDPVLRGANGVSLAEFGSAATPLVKTKHESLQKLVGMQLAKWCLLQAEQSGLKAQAAPGNPSNIRLR